MMRLVQVAQDLATRIDGKLFLVNYRLREAFLDCDINCTTGSESGKLAARLALLRSLTASVGSQPFDLWAMILILQIVRPQQINQMAVMSRCKGNYVVFL
jgi:hypothetical protein